MYKSPKRLKLPLFLITITVNVTPGLYACQLSYDSNVMILRKVFMFWLTMALFLNECHGEDQAYRGRWRGIFFCTCRSVSWSIGMSIHGYYPNLSIYNWLTRLKAGPL